jgi:hypothetical protein
VARDKSDKLDLLCTLSSALKPRHKAGAEVRDIDGVYVNSSIVILP